MVLMYLGGEDSEEGLGVAGHESITGSHISNVPSLVPSQVQLEVERSMNTGNTSACTIASHPPFSNILLLMLENIAHVF